jgi:hypothetical protein
MGLEYVAAPDVVRIRIEQAHRGGRPNRAKGVQAVLSGPALPLRKTTIHLGRVSTVENWIRFRLALPRAFGNVGRCIIVQEIKGSAYGANGYARTKNCGRVDIDINYPVWHPDAPSTCEYPGVTWLPSQAVWSDSPGAGTLGEDSLPFMWRTSFRTGVYDRMRLGDLSCRTFKARRPQPLRVYEWGIEFTVLKDRKGKPKVVTKVW